MKSKSLLFVAGAALAFVIAIGTANAATMTGKRSANWTKPAVRGKVTAISGTTLTVANASSTVFTVDASNATVMKIVAGAKAAASTVSAIQTGDTVSVMGTLSGTSVTATSIRDGVMTAGKGTMVKKAVMTKTAVKSARAKKAVVKKVMIKTVKK